MTDTTYSEPRDELPLEWICDALDRNRSHVAVFSIAPITHSASAPALLTQRLADRLEVVTTSLATLEADAALARILNEREAWGVASLEIQLQRKLTELSDRGAALVLALPDATSIPAETLRRIGDIASAFPRTLRLALLVDCTAAEVDGAASALVRNLGVGLEKVVVGRQAPREAERRASIARGWAHGASPTAPIGPPRIEAEPTRTAAIRMRGGTARRPSHPLAWAVAGVLAALQIAWWSAPAFERPPVRQAGPPLAEVSRAAAKPAVPRFDRIESLEDAKHEEGTTADPHSSAEEKLETDAASAESDTPPEAPVARPPEIPAAPVAQARTVSVNLNADPWAHVELDGRPLGATPLGKVPMKLGVHQLTLRFPDGHHLDRTIEVDGSTLHFRFP